VKPDARSSWPTYLALSADLISAKGLVWFARIRTGGDLTPDAHLYFFDRYFRLAEWHRVRGRVSRARRLAAIADEHYRAGGDHPPRAAGMALPGRLSFTRTNAVSRSRSVADDVA
jgi:hypothetical protein